MELGGDAKRGQGDQRGFGDATLMLSELLHAEPAVPSAVTPSAPSHTHSRRDAHRISQSVTFLVGKVDQAP